jgi:outer membrane protein OmpA-like peptidoglycan-associated protein
MRRNRSSWVPNVWPVVADFFLALLAVFVFVEARAGRPNAELERELRRIGESFTPLVNAKKVKEANIEYPEARIVLSDQYLSFPTCGWILTPEKASEVERVLDLFLPVQSYISALNIEGHADRRSAAGCTELSLRTNFELSQRRALAVYAGLLRVTLDKVEEAESFGGAQDGVVWQLRQRHRISVAGYGDTRPWPETPDPLSDAHRRVEIKFSFCRDATDQECSMDVAVAPVASAK